MICFGSIFFFFSSLSPYVTPWTRGTHGESSGTRNGWTSEKLCYRSNALKSTMAFTIFIWLLATCHDSMPSVAMGQDTFETTSPSRKGHYDSLYFSESPKSSALENLPALRSPECWKRSAITLLHDAQDFLSDASKLCKIMPEEDQKRLALLIAKCHLEDLGKQLIDDEVASHHCHQSILVAEKPQGRVSWCLRQLTDVGADAYTYYVSYVQQLCVRLTRDLMVTHQQETQKIFVSRFVNLSKRSMEQMETIALTTERLVLKLDELSEFPKRFKNALGQSLQNFLEVSIRQTLDENLSNQLLALIDARVGPQLGAHLEQMLSTTLSNVMQQQLHYQAMYFENFMEEVERKESDHKLKYELWTEALEARWQDQIDNLVIQRQQVDLLSETLSKTAREMRPLLDIEKMVSVVVSGYSWLSFLLYFLVMLNIVWLVTRPARCEHFRSYLIAIVFMEAAVETSLCCMVYYHVISETTRLLLITDIRRTALFLELSCYVVGMVRSLVVTTYCKSNRQPNTVHEEFFEDFQCRCDTLLNRLEGAAEIDRSRERTMAWEQDNIAAMNGNNEIPIAHAKHAASKIHTVIHEVSEESPESAAPQLARKTKAQGSTPREYCFKTSTVPPLSDSDQNRRSTQCLMEAEQLRKYKSEASNMPFVTVQDPWPSRPEWGPIEPLQPTRLCLNENFADTAANDCLAGLPSSRDAPDSSLVEQGRMRKDGVPLDMELSKQGYKRSVPPSSGDVGHPEPKRGRTDYDKA